MPGRKNLQTDCAMCSDSRKRRADKECMLLISEVASPEGPRMLFLYQRWCPLILMIAGALDADQCLRMLVTYPRFAKVC